MRRRRKLVQKIWPLAGSIAVLCALLAASAAWQRVEFADAGLEAAVREKLGNPRRPIARAELLQISRLDASGRQISRLEGIENLRQLVFLDLSKNTVQDLSPLKTLRRLRELDLSQNSLVSLEAVNFAALSGLPLRGLSLNWNAGADAKGRLVPLSDISALGDLPELQALEARGDEISDIGPLRGLSRLRLLDLRYNRVTDISPLNGLVALALLDLGDNDVSRLSPLANLAGLSYLNLGSNRSIRDLRPIEHLAGLTTLVLDEVPAAADGLRFLARLARLRRLELRDCGIDGESDLAALGGLVALRSLGLRGNRVTDLSPLSGLSSLEELDLRDNDAADLAPLAGLKKLSYLNLHSNTRVRSLRPLADLPGLQTLIMRNVPVGKEIGALKNLSRLERLNLRNCGVESAGPLRALARLRSLDLRGNPLTDLSPLKGLGSLEVLDLRENDVADLAPLAGLKKLSYLNLHSNRRIGSLEPLKDLTGLKTLIMRNVPAGGSISALRKLKSLRRLNVRNCGIADTAVLGELMAAGALRDDPGRGEEAEVNLLDNPLPAAGSDPYRPIRPYWGSISRREPFALPYAPSAVSPPVFSREGGFYGEPFDLELAASAPGAAIHYTLGGSEPTERSAQYAGPLRIEPGEDRSSGTVVRARATGEGGETSDVVTHTYFVGEGFAAGHALPAFSLAMDKADLFDREFGIYHGRNESQTGWLWERPVSVEFFEPSGRRALNADGGVRIHGGSSREHKQKSLRLYARPEYGPSDAFRYPFFPGLKKTGSGEPLAEFKTLVLRNSGNDRETLFRDVLMQGLVEHSPELETQSSRPVRVYLNGMYWGLYNLRERHDEYYLAAYYDVAPGRVAILEQDAKVKHGTIRDREEYLALREYARAHDLSDPAHYRHVAQMMDPRSYIDYYAANIYFHNTDWPHNNIVFWRIRPEGDGSDPCPGRDGRWRWMLNSTDYGFGLRGPSIKGFNSNAIKSFESRFGTLRGPAANTLEWALQERDCRLKEEWPNLLFRSLLANGEFRNAFINRMADELNSSFKPERVIQRIDELEAALLPELAAQIRRWGEIGSVEEWRRNVEWLRRFARERPEHVRRHFAEHFGLGGCARVTLQADQREGHVRINELDVSEATPGIVRPQDWTGVYFRGVPVRIAAIPEKGYRFAGWEGTEFKEAEITVVPEGDLELAALFERE